VLLAARNTRFYGPLLESAGLGSEERILEVSSLEDLLLRLPAAAAPGVYSSALLNSGEPARRPDLFWPLPPAGRTAILGTGFRERRGVTVFPRPSRGPLLAYGPDALAGPVTGLRLLAEGAEDRGAPVPRLRHSVLAFSCLGHGFLSDEARDLFWRVFRVPVFGQILSPGCNVLAWECEAHEGYHFARDRVCFENGFRDSERELLATSLIDLRRPALRLATGLSGDIEERPCGCGEPGPRLVNLRRRAALKREAQLGTACAAD